MASKSEEDILLKMLKSKRINVSDITNYLRNHNIDLDKLDSHGYNFLHYAIKSENYEVVNLMLHHLGEDSNSFKADPNVKTNDDSGKTHLSPLLLTLQIVSDNEFCYKIIKALIKAGADVLEKDENNCNLMHRAAEKGRTDIINLYLETCESKNVENPINIASNYGTALHMALLGDQEDTIGYLLDNKVDLSFKDNYGNNVLILAIQLRSFNSFKLICDFITKSSEIPISDKKSIFNTVNNDGNSIYHELAYTKSSVLIDFIKKFNEEYKVDEDLVNKEGYTYKGVQENIIKLQKEREDKIKADKELLRKEKEKVLEERKQEILQEKARIENMRKLEEKTRERTETLVKYRSHIFLGFFALLMIVLFIAVTFASKKKKKENVI